jgi:hypothetical protein
MPSTSDHRLMTGRMLPGMEPQAVKPVRRRSKSGELTKPMLLRIRVYRSEGWSDERIAERWGLTTSEVAAVSDV